MASFALKPPAGGRLSLRGRTLPAGEPLSSAGRVPAWFPGRPNPGPPVVPSFVVMGPTDLRMFVSRRMKFPTGNLPWSIGNGTLSAFVQSLIYFTFDGQLHLSTAGDPMAIGWTVTVPENDQTWLTEDGAPVKGGIYVIG